MLQSKAVDNMTADQNLVVNRHKQQQAAAAQALQRTTAVGIATTGATHLHQPQGEREGGLVLRVSYRVRVNSKYVR